VISRPRGSAILALAAVALPFSLAARQTKSESLSDWPAFEGNAAATHFSPLDEINRDTVKDLTEAWSYPLGSGVVSSEPLVLPDRLIAAGPDNSIVALDPGTGKELWRVKPEIRLPSVRGFAYWRSKDGSEERVFFPQGTSLRALDPRTGTILPDFYIDLRQGLDRDPQRIRFIAPTSPGRVFENMIILGSITGEGYDSPPGDIRAFDVRTGRMVWNFHTIPRPGEFGHETWPKDAWTYAGAANDWGGMTIDEKRGLLFFVTGSPVYDFYGADRKGDNLFGNSLVAVDVRTGAYRWHFQAVHHDLWDYDVVASPTLMTVRKDGKSILAVVVATKHGFLFAFDRVTGKSLYPIEERPVPASDVPGEHASPTQPFSGLPPFARQTFTEADVDPALPADKRETLIKRIRAARNDGLFTPPTLGRETLQMPGNHGGANWGQTGADPNGRYYVASFDLPAFLLLAAPVDPQELQRIAAARGRGAASYSQNCQMCHGESRAGSDGIPSLVGIGGRMSEAQIREVILNGRSTMPGFPHLAGEELDALVGWLLADGKVPPAPPTPSRAGPPQAVNSPDGSPRYRSGYNQVDFAIRPPWQTVTSYDLNTGRIVWQVPVGKVPGRAEATGRAFVKGGLTITAGGLVFIATDADRKLHAYNSATGAELWSGDLRSHPRGGIVTYRYRGRQYVVVPAGFSGLLSGLLEIPGTPKGENAYVAFALPERRS
jgi:quinoprotein glucose dehydrogenase